MGTNQDIALEERGVTPGEDGKITCQRCGKRMAERNFYSYKNGKKCEKNIEALRYKAFLPVENSVQNVDNFFPHTTQSVIHKNCG